MAGTNGLEPSTSCVTGRRSNQLNYAPARETISYIKKSQFTSLKIKGTLEGVDLIIFWSFFMHVMVSFLFVFVFGMGVCHADTFFSKHYKMNFEVPEQWEVISDKQQKHIYIVHPEKIATINITGYYFEEPVTANGFQKIRMGGSYDGWINRFEREGTAFESSNANVEESYIAVYSKHQLQEDMTALEIMVGEYYYVKGHNAYTIGIITDQNKWADIQQVIRKVVESFWIGEGVKPFVEKEEEKSLNWGMSGKDSQNLFQIAAQPAFNSVLQEIWSIPLKSFDKQSNASLPLVTEEVVVFVDNGKLHCVSVQTGVEKWSFSLKHQIKTGLVSHEGVLYLVQEENLYAILLENGDTLFKKELNDSDSEIGYYADSLFYVDHTMLTRLSADTGSVQLQKELLLPSSFFPVASVGKLLIAHDKQIRLFRSHDGFVEWVYTLESPLAFAPFMKNSLCGFVEKKEGQWGCSVLDIQTGKLLWRVNFKGADKKYMGAPVVYNNSILMVIYEKFSNQKTLISYDSRSGAELWKEVLKDSNKPTFQPIIADNVALVDFHDQILAVDMLTGESIYVRSMQLDKTNNRQTELVRAYKNFLLKVDVSDEGHRLVCEQ